MKKIKSFGEFVNESNSEFSNYSNYSAINEEFDLKAFFANMKNYGKKIAGLEPILTAEWDLKLEKENNLNDFDEAIEDKLHEFDKKKEAMIRKKLKGMDVAKKPAARKALEETFTQKRQVFKEKLTVKKTTYTAKIDQEIKKAGTDAIAELEKEYPTTDYMEAKYQEEKFQIKLKVDDKYGQMLQDIKMAQIEKAEDPERMKRFQDRQKELDKNAEAAKKERQAELEEDLQKAETKRAQLEASATGDQQAALQEIKKFYTAVTTYTGIAAQIAALKANEGKGAVYSYQDLLGILKNAEINEDAEQDKEKLKDLTARITKAAKDMVVPSMSLLKKGFGNDTDAENAKEEMTAIAQEAKEAYSEAKSGGESVKVDKSELDDVDDGAGDVESDDEGYDDEAAKTAAVSSAEQALATAQSEVATAKQAVKDATDKPLADYSGNTDAEKDTAKKAAIAAAEQELENKVNAEGAASKELNSAKTKGIKKKEQPTQTVSTSFDTSDFDRYAMKENKNVLSFEEFVNESRKNGFTF